MYYKSDMFQYFFFLHKYRSAVKNMMKNIGNTRMVKNDERDKGITGWKNILKQMGILIG